VIPKLLHIFSNHHEQNINILIQASLVLTLVCSYGNKKNNLILKYIVPAARKDFAKAGGVEKLVDLCLNSNQPLTGRVAMALSSVTIKEKNTEEYEEGSEGVIALSRIPQEKFDNLMRLLENANEETALGMYTMLRHLSLFEEGVKLLAKDNSNNIIAYLVIAL